MEREGAGLLHAAHQPRIEIVCTGLPNAVRPLGKAREAAEPAIHVVLIPKYIAQHVADAIEHSRLSVIAVRSAVTPGCRQCARILDPDAPTIEIVSVADAIDMGREVA